MKSKPQKTKVCSRGHEYEGSGPCPGCWPGYYKKPGQSKYLDEITTLLKRVCPKLSITHQLEFKNVFGAVGGYVNGKIFISCGKFGVALKLPKEVLDDLFKEEDVKHLKYFPNGHIKKEYAALSKRVLRNKNQLKKLVDESIKYVLSERK